MKVTINRRQWQFEGETIEDLFKTLKTPFEEAIVKVNGRTVTDQNFTLHEDDVVEIINK